MTDLRPNIWLLQSQRDIPALLRALEHEDAAIRQRAAIALRALEAFEAIPMLRQALAKEANPEARTNITAALVHLIEEQSEREEELKPISPPDDLELFVSQLKARDHEEIVHAAQALGALGDPLAVEPLMIVFNDKQYPARVRLAAAEALIELKSPPATVTVLVALRRPDPHLRRIAAAMMGHLEADWAVEPLRRALKDENELVARTARAALKHIGTPEALKALDSTPEREPEKVEKVEAPAQPEPEDIASAPEARPEAVTDGVASESTEPPEASTATKAASDVPVSEAKPEESPRPEWSVEETRPSRPEGLDEAIAERTSEEATDQEKPAPETNRNNSDMTKPAPPTSEAGDATNPAPENASHPRQ